MIDNSRALAVSATILLLSATGLCRAGEGNVDLLGQRDLRHFRETKGWRFVDSVAVIPGEMAFRLQGTGDILVNGATKAKIPYLYTNEEFQDVMLHLEFTVPKRSNAGVYLQGRYEIQILDSYGVAKPTHSDLGGLYQRWDENREPKGYGGVAPRINAAKPPGQWQTLDITFRAPRFDSSGNKTANARFVSVLVNGQVVHENQEVSGPTRAAQYSDEQPRGPILIQGDHGPIAIRQFVVTPIELD